MEKIFLMFLTRGLAFSACDLVSAAVKTTSQEIRQNLDNDSM